MKMPSVSSTSVSTAMRTAILRAQAELNKAQKELASGKLADTGLALGARTTQVVNFQRDLDRLGGIVDSNALVTSRLSSTQGALDNLSAAAQQFLTTLTAATSGDATPEVMRDSARAALDGLTSIMNLALNGEHLFAGINTDVKPINAFEAGSAPKTAFDNAFLSYFGFAQDAPAAAAITAAQMDDFLTNAVEPQFMGAGWQANWSNATDQAIVSRVALNETTATSVGANHDGVRLLAMAAATIGDLFSGNIGAAGRDALVARAFDMVGQAIGDIANLQSQVGVIQSRVKAASDRTQVQIDLFDKQLIGMQGVDPYEASTRVTELLSHIETSYALTARIQQLSLLKYL
ncbi:MAG: flagellar hook-associated family protein [Rhizobiaceae bacterium]